MEMIQRLHLLLTIQQPQLHKLISELESKLIDVYIDSKEKNNCGGFLKTELSVCFVENFFDLNKFNERI